MQDKKILLSLLLLGVTLCFPECSSQRECRVVGRNYRIRGNCLRAGDWKTEKDDSEHRITCRCIGLFWKECTKCKYEDTTTTEGPIETTSTQPEITTTTPEMPDITTTTPEMPDITTTAPEVPDVTTTAPEMPDVTTTAPEMPDITTTAPEMPDITTTAPEMPDITTTAPEMPDITTTAPEIPETLAPGLPENPSVPELPQVPSETSPRNIAERASWSGKRTTPELPGASLATSTIRY